MLPTGQATSDGGISLCNLLVERRVHFYTHKKTHLRCFVNGYLKRLLKQILGKSFSLLSD